MTGQTPRTCDDELLLARISEAAGRAHLGRRLATCPVVPDRPGVTACPLVGRWATRRYRGARLDRYEHGLTAAISGRIQVVRYDTTSVFQRRAGCTLTDVRGKRVSFRDVQHWGPEILRGVTRTQLPGALAALDRGDRIAFGRLRLSRERLGSVPWARIQRIEILNGSVTLVIDGTWHRPGTPVAEIPNFSVFLALVSRCHRNFSANS